ncbi:MAG: Sm ribonucleo-like protein [Acidobacteria bacterium]|nr:MAG: Sm ribonucleo-like protein [Acidobacteriota bacterium]
MNDRNRPYFGGNNNHNHHHQDRYNHHRGPDRREERHSGPPESTGKEVEYIKQLIENHTPVRVRLDDNSEVSGVIEYYDRSFIRLTRESQPNLLIFKDKIKYLYEG